MPNTVGGYWGTQQFARDLPLPVIYASTQGGGFAGGDPLYGTVHMQPPHGVVAGDTLLIVCNIRMHGAEAELATIISVPGDWNLIWHSSVAVGQPNPSQQYIYRKTATASEVQYEVVRYGAYGAGFMNSSVNAIRGAGTIDGFVNVVPPAPHYIPAITTTKPNTLLFCAYTAKDPLDQFIPMPPGAPIWYAVGSPYVWNHWNNYQRDALIEGTYGPTTTHGGASHAVDQYTVMAIAPLPAAPKPDLTITYLEPNAGLIGGGTTVIIHGTSFAVGATSVTIGSVTIPAGSVTVTDGVTATFVTPAGPGGVTSVQAVTATVGAYTTNAKSFTYNTGGFSPSQIDGLLYWLDASEPSSVSTSGSNVTEWRDFSTNRYVFNASPQPTYTGTVYGLNVMQFTADSFQCATKVLNVQPYTFAWVMNPTLSGSQQAIYSQQFNQPTIEITTTGTITLNGMWHEIDTGVACSGLHAWVVLMDGPRSKMWKDGVLVWTSDVVNHPGSGFADGVPRIANNTHDFYRFTGVMPEFAVYATTFSGTDLTNLSQSWLDKWGIGGTAPTVSGAPTLNTATPATPTSVALAWTAPSSNGGSSIIDYIVERSNNGTSGWTVVADGFGTTTSYTVTGLTSDVIQYFRVIAVNGIGNSAPSSVLSATPTATVPDAPTLTNATSGDTQVALAWSAPANNGGATISNYLVETSANGTTGWSTVTTINALAYTHTGRTNGTVYYYRVSAINSVGTGAASNVRSATPAVPPAGPTIASVGTEVGLAIGATPNPQPSPSGVAAGDLLVAFVANDSSGTATVASTGWTKVDETAYSGNIVKLATFARIADGGANDALSITGTTTQDYCTSFLRITGHGVSNVANIRITAATGVSGNADPPNLDATTSANHLWLAAAAVDLGPGDAITAVPSGYTQAHAPLKSENSSSSVALGVGSRVATAQTEDPPTFTNTSQEWVAVTLAIAPYVPPTVPDAPTLNSATAGNTQVALAWTAGSTGGSAITSYLVEKSNNGTSGWTSAGTPTASPHTVTGLTNDTIQYFRVSAINIVGMGAASNVLSATPTAAPSGFAKYRTFNGTTDVISWTLGNLSTATTSPQTMVCVFRPFAVNGQIIQVPPSYDPFDWFYIDVGGTNRLCYYDGSTNIYTDAPALAVNSWVLATVRASPGVNAKFSMSYYNGTSWPTPTHTTPSGIFNARSFATNGPLIGNALNADIVLVARFNTSLSDAEINNMINGVGSIYNTPGITNLWMVGQAAPADLIGTSIPTTTGTTLSTGDSPFPAGTFGFGGPDDITNLKYWYNVDDAASRTVNGSSQLTALASQGGGTYGPALTVNSYALNTLAPTARTSVRLTASGSGMSAALSSNFQPDAMTAMVVCRFVSGPTYTRLLSFSGSGADWDNVQSICFGREGGILPSVGSSGNARGFLSASSEVADTWMVVTYVLNGTTCKIRVNGTEVASGSFGLIGDINAPRIGWGIQGSGVNDPFNGEQSEVVVYDRALTTTEVTDLETYMMGRWLVYSDNFNRTNANLTTPWVLMEGVVATVVSNKVRASVDTAGSFTYYDATVAANQWAEATVTWAAGFSASLGVCVRMGTSTGGNMYYTYANVTTGQASVWKRVSNSYSQVGSNVAITGLTHKVRLEAEGTTIRCYIDGIKTHEVTDTSISSGRIGLVYSSASGNFPVGDDWRGGNLPYVP